MKPANLFGYLACHPDLNGPIQMFSALSKQLFLVNPSPETKRFLVLD